RPNRRRAPTDAADHMPCPQPAMPCPQPAMPCPQPEARTRRRELPTPRPTCGHDYPTCGHDALPCGHGVARCRGFTSCLMQSLFHSRADLSLVLPHGMCEEDVHPRVGEYLQQDPDGGVHKRTDDLVVER